MNYLRISHFDVANGEGVRTALFVTGCSTMPCAQFCFNKAIQDFKSGKPFDEAAHDEVMQSLEPDYIDGITLLGGEPFLNFHGLVPLVEDIREEFGDSKTVWGFSGFTFEQIIPVKSRMKLLRLCDVLVDGPFMPDAYSDKLRFRGSANQRILDVQASLDANSPIWRKGYEKEYEEYRGWQNAPSII